MLEDFQGDSWGSIPPLRMSSLLPHDLCHGRSASRRPPTGGRGGHHQEGDIWGRRLRLTGGGAPLKREPEHRSSEEAVWVEQAGPVAPDRSAGPSKAMVRAFALSEMRADWGASTRWHHQTRCLLCCSWPSSPRDFSQTCKSAFSAPLSASESIQP